MKKLLAGYIILVLSFVCLSAPVLAQSSGNALNNSCSVAGADKSPVCADGKTGDTNPVSGPAGILQKAIRIIQILAGVAAVIMIIIGGLEYVMSTGDSAKLNTAKNTILFAVIGLIITIVAQLIIVFVVRRL